MVLYECNKDVAALMKRRKVVVMNIYRYRDYKVLEYVDKYGVVYVVFKSFLGILPWPVFRCYGYNDMLDYVNHN